MNKKGSIVDLAVAIIGAFILSLVFLLVSYIWVQLSGSILFSGTAALPVVHGLNTAYSILDDSIVIFFFMTCIAAIILAYFVQSHPVFALIPIIVLIPLTIISIVFADTWQTVISDSFFVVLGNTYMFYATAVFRYLPILTLTMGIIMLIVMYAKPTKVGSMGY